MSKNRLVKEVVGKEIDKAKAMIIAAGLTVRVRRIDSKGFMGTCDFRTDRINLDVDGGLVTEAKIG